MRHGIDSQIPSLHHWRLYSFGGEWFSVAAGVLPVAFSFVG
jgi:hypothetical protein